MAHELNPLTFPLNGTRLIEASAGTGKTYTIAALYLRLVLGHGGENGFPGDPGSSRPLTPPEILVVTFTNAATEELRDRIRSRLTEAASFFRGQGDGDPYLNDLRNEYQEDEWPSLARLLDQAAQWMDESAIHTIHAWSQRMLRQHAFDSGSLFDLELEAGDQDLLLDAARDYWRCFLYPRPAGELSEIISLLNCSSPDDLLYRIRPLFGYAEGDLNDPFEILSKRRSVLRDAKKRWAADMENAVALIRQAQSDKSLNGNKYRAASLEKWVAQLSRWVNENGLLPDAQAMEKLSDSGLSAGLSKKGIAPEHPAFAVFDDLTAELEGLDVETAFLNHAAVDVSRRFKDEKLRRAQMGFDDLLTRLNEALMKPGNERLAHVIRKQFPVALIDEFQDTDPVQYQTFSKVYLGQESTGLFMIGDPKQAIYAFRGADINTYLMARKDTEGRHYTLGRNYRSTKGVVYSVNRMFEAATGHPEGAFLFKDDIPFDPVEAQGRKEFFEVEGGAVPAMNIWQMDQDAPVSKTGEDGYLGRMAESAATEIVKLLSLAENSPPRAGFREENGELTPLSPADIAVLVRDGTEARAVRKALDARHVRSVYLSDKESVFESIEARSLLYLLSACAEPEQERVLRTALATAILDLPMDRIDLLNRDEVLWEREVERFRNYRTIWQRQGVLPMLRSMFHDFEVPGRLLSRPGGERLLTNLLHLSEMLQIAAASLDGEASLIRWLAEHIQQDIYGADDQILRLESDDDLVRVVTIHKSKGLEYPLVFLPFICSFRQVTERNTPVVKYHDSEGNLIVRQKPDDEELAIADRERLAEDLRMLYVALTRPRYACWLGVGVMGRKSSRGETSNLHLSGLGYLLSGNEKIPTDMLGEKLLDIRGECGDIHIMQAPDSLADVYEPPEDNITLEKARNFTGHVPRNWWITSYSGLLSGASMEEAGEVPETPLEFSDSPEEELLKETAGETSEAPAILAAARSIHRFPRGPEPGTFLHDLLEWAARETFEDRDDAGFGGVRREDAMARISEACTRRGWEEWTETVTDWFMELINTRIPLGEKDSFSLAGLAPENYQPEMEFLFSAHNVDTQVLDKEITENYLPGMPRPRLRRSHLSGMVKGFVDLVFFHGGKYYVLDYKSNHMGESSEDYILSVMKEGMLEHRYDLQSVLYTLALHRLLKSRITDYDYDRDVGGAIYLYLRGVSEQGHGVYTSKPSRELMEKLDSYFTGEEDYDAA